MPRITLLFVGLSALMQFGLALAVIVRRRQTGIDFLDGGDEALLRRIRAHGNFSEVVPIALLVLLGLELAGVAAAWLWLMGVSLLLGRVLNACGLLTQHPLSRAMRMGGTVLCLNAVSLGAVACVWLAIT
jgi:uncharacterized protein